LMLSRQPEAMSSPDPMRATDEFYSSEVNANG